MTPHEFVQRWQAADLSERAACQSHFADLCAVLGQPKPTDVDPTGEWYAFEKGVESMKGKTGWAEVGKSNAREASPSLSLTTLRLDCGEITLHSLSPPRASP